MSTTGARPARLDPRFPRITRENSKYPELFVESMHSENTTIRGVVLTGLG
jgi:hypothetical protein